MKYLFLIYDQEKNWVDLDEKQQGEVMKAHMAFSEAAQAAGKMVGGEALEPTTSATTVSVRDGKTTTTDGPFMETKEQLGGYYVLDCSDLDDAIAWAARIPEAVSGRVEVRPLMVFD